MAIQNAYIGTELKYAFTITAEGFSMEDDDFSIEVTNGRKSIVIPKDECFKDEHDQWYFTFDSTLIGTGMIRAIFRAQVPDEDFDDNFRGEVAKVDLVYIKSL